MNPSYDLSGKRVLVAGHRGMVGSALVRRLASENCTILTLGRNTVDLRRQAEVEDHRVVILGRAEEMPLLAIGGEVDGIARTLQRGTQLAAEIGFVLDDQDVRTRHRPSFHPSRPALERGAGDVS